MAEAIASKKDMHLWVEKGDTCQRVIKRWGKGSIAKSLDGILIFQRE